MPLPAPPAQEKDSKPTQKIEFEGQQHEFPPDFTDADIQRALSQTETNPTTGIVTPAGSTGSDESSVLGGMARRLGASIKGAYETFVAPPQTKAEEHMPTGVWQAWRGLSGGAGGDKRGGGEAREDGAP